MSQAWVAVLAVGAGTVVLKSVGPVIVGGKPVPPRLFGILTMLAPALLAALVVTEGFAHGRSLVLDARLAGLAAGALAVALRAPIWAVVLAGAAATALVRLVS
ncbi:MAG TPA: AzlD domain-containing protein [Gaiellaceae bacterium]|nr:AzlD domain-containing protein [Gaiellaceae bacterium]